MNSRSNNDQMDNFYQRGASGNSQRVNNGFQITTDNYFHHFEPSVARVEFGSADSYITPPARQLEQLEYKNSWFHPPKKSKKFVRRYLDSSEMQQISKKLNFFDEQVTSSSSESQSSHQTQNSGLSMGMMSGNDQIDHLNYEEMSNNYQILNNNSMNYSQSNGSTPINGINCFNKNRNVHNGGGFSQNYSGQQNNQQYATQSNNRNNQKYSKAPSNPESILKFR